MEFSEHPSIRERILARCQSVCGVVGIGVSNLPLIRFLTNHGARVVARDRKTATELGEGIVRELEERGVRLVLGADYLSELTEQVIFRTPGLRPDLPAFRRAVENGALLTSEMEWFLELTPARVIGVTGSDGKTTTTTLTYRFLAEESRLRGGGKVFVGGNIGEPLLPRVEEMTSRDFAVVELSSFQLMGLQVSPWRAAVTNLSPNHLNWHTDMDEYVAAKTNIYAHAPNTLLVTNAENEITARLAASCSSPVTLFSSHRRPSGAASSVYEADGWIVAEEDETVERVLPIDAIRVPGIHNLENYMTAIALCRGLVGNDAIRSVAADFTGVAHRLELIRTVNGVKYYNSSIDSTPTRTAAALSALHEKPIVICGGYDKHLPFGPLAEALAARAKAVVLTGATAEKIASAIAAEPRARELPVRMARDFREAVEQAHAMAKEGDTVLLSPACASFDAFRNFEERGDAFRTIVESFS